MSFRGSSVVGILFWLETGSKGVFRDVRDRVYVGSRVEGDGRK